MTRRKKRQYEIIDRNFGKNPLEQNIFYCARDRMDKIARYHKTMLESENDNENTGDENTDSENSVNEDAVNENADTQNDVIKNNKNYIDDITWEDLEMDEVYLRINHTNSFIGEQLLYHKLHDVGAGTRHKVEGRVSYLEENPKCRREIERRLQLIGKREGTYYLTEFLQKSNLWKVGSSLVLHLLQLILLFVIIGAIISDNELFFFGLVISASVNLIVYIRAKMKYEVYLESLCVFKQIYDFAAWIEKSDSKQNIFVTPKEKKAIESLKKVSNVIFKFYGRKQSNLSSDVFALLSDYIWGVTLVDISLFNYIMKIIYDKQDDVMELLEMTGSIDVCISILSYRKSVDYWCIPEFVESGFKAEEMVHPLLGHPVANDFELVDRAIISGANASGKSTFMKAVAINCILAQTINTCTARRLCLARVYIMTCMSLRDDVMSGESYFFREAKYLKRILSVIECDNMEKRSTNTVLCVIDEILKGTNTKERIAASKAILDYISDRNCLAIVATHDNELTENSMYKQFHFESHIIENDMKFDYKIKDGVSSESNAIALLSVLGYPNNIIKNAMENMR